MLKLPIATPEGPLFVTPVRYHCKNHGCTVRAGSKEDADECDDPYALNVVYYRLGDMRYTTGVITDLHGTYVDILTFAGCRRSLLNRWLSHGLRAATAVKRKQCALGFRSDFLQRGARALLALEDFLPSDKSIGALMLVLYKGIVEPQLERYDACVCAFDGQLVRLDGTFKCASVVRAYAPWTGGVGRHRRTTGDFKKVGSCVLVAVGLEGLCLTTPRLVRAENGPSIEEVATYVMRARRAVLGSTSAPAAFVTDCIRQHKNVLWSALALVYPELATSVEDEELDINDVVLMLQDIPHREWAFTRQAATPKHHPDHADYCAAIQEVFHRLRIPYDQQVHDRQVQSLELWMNTWSKEAARITGDTVSLRTAQNQVQRGILECPTSNRKDDEMALEYITCVGGAAVEDVSFLTEYVPRRVVLRAARRLLVPAADVEFLFPKQGYADSEDFLLQLQAVNVFYKVVRSAAAQEAPGVVANRLGEVGGRRRAQGLLGARRREAKLVEPENRRQQEQQEVMVGIADKKLVADALVACAHEAVTTCASCCRTRAAYPREACTST